MEHLQYIVQEPNNSVTSIEQTVPHARSVGLQGGIIDSIRGYRESYRIGVEKFGVWWKIFQLSIWSFVLIFILTAVIILVVYLPKIEMIYWQLR
jgi:hypothetical protein